MRSPRKTPREERRESPETVRTRERRIKRARSRPRMPCRRSLSRGTTPRTTGRSRRAPPRLSREVPRRDCEGGPSSWEREEERATTRATPSTRRLRQAWLEGGSKFSQGIKYLNATDDTHAETRRLYAKTRDECASVQEDADKDGEQARKRLRGAEVHPLVRLTSKDVEIDDAAAYTRMLARSILNL